MENMKQQSQIHLAYNMSLWNGTYPNPGPPSEILDRLCLAECGKAGDCVECKFLNTI